MWTVKFRDGGVKRFKFPIRTTAEGEAQPLAGYEGGDDIESANLMTEPASTGADALPTW